ncbi:MAG: DMT family transporter [Candidatus Tectomicrobia bacterium]|uniref:DMT family transporter n=1 Tax=Tectimicrobiota bacterium TaxID=2528274 RepID=A0A932MPC3_UNCTE|nr:DMT family transporter [Candidatus Tectomicrobia bacterium]
MNPGDHALGLAFATVAALAWAAFSFLVKMALRDAPVLRVTACLTTLNALLVTLFALAVLPLASFAPKIEGTLLWVLLSGVFHIGISRSFFYLAIHRLGPNRSVPVAMSYPFVTALVAWPLLGEPLTLRIVLGLAVLLLGISLIVSAAPAQSEGASPSPGWRTLGWIAAGVTSILWGVSAVFFKRASLDIHPVAVASFALMIGAVVAWAIAAGEAARSKLPPIPRRAWPWLLIASVFQAAAVPSYNYALKHTLAVNVTAIVSAQPLIALVVGWLFLRESENITPRLCAGALLTVAGTLIVVS